MNTVIITDSSCDLPLKYIEENNVETLGLICHIDGEEHVDDFGKTFRYETFYDKLKKGSMPTTSQINVYRFEEVFKKYVKEKKSIIYLSMSSSISGCYNSANIAKQLVKDEFEEADITLIDTKSASIGEGILVYTAIEMLKGGSSKDEIISWIEENKLKINHWFVVEDLLHLKRGGRLSATKANIGTFLKIKPILCIDREGRIQNVDSVRGRKKAIKVLIDRFEENIQNPEEAIVGISHGNCIEDAENIKNILIEKYKVKKVILNYVGPVIGSHTGEGMIAVCFLGNERNL